jgi:hypothetical protein
VSRRYIDLRIAVCVADVERDASGRPRWKPGTDEQLGVIGGRFDTRRKRWVAGKPKTKLTIRFHRGQELAARWYFDWLRRFVRGDWGGDYRRAWSVLLIGGRRSGKTHLACAALFVFAVFFPKARIWALSPTLETGDELDEALKEIMPARWYRRRQAKTGRATTFTLANGSRILLKSAVKPGRLKAGRVDMALLNEAQELSQTAYLKIRAAVADRGGVVLIAANPPDAIIGKWVEDHYLGAKAGSIPCEVFEFDPRNNPWIEYEGLLTMASEADEKTYQRDVLGLFAPIGDVVFYAWDADANWRDPPAHLIDVTAEVTRRELGHVAGDVVGMDFQQTPAMVGIPIRFYRDPTDPSGDILTWVVDEIVAPETDEDGLVDALESTPRYRLGDGAPETRKDEDGNRGFYAGAARPGDRGAVHAAVVADASGFYQDGAHRMDRTSDRWLIHRGWRHLFKPQRDNDNNPGIGERMKAGNARLRRGSDGKNLLFVARHCKQTAEAFRLYENKNGKPNRRSQYAHVIDAVTYVIYRFFGRPKQPATRQEYRGLARFERAVLFDEVADSAFGVPRSATAAEKAAAKARALPAPTPAM